MSLNDSIEFPPFNIHKQDDDDEEDGVNSLQQSPSPTQFMKKLTEERQLYLDIIARSEAARALNFESPPREQNDFLEIPEDMADMMSDDMKKVAQQEAVQSEDTLLLNPPGEFLFGQDTPIEPDRKKLMQLMRMAKVADNAASQDLLADVLCEAVLFDSDDTFTRVLMPENCEDLSNWRPKLSHIMRMLTSVTAISSSDLSLVPKPSCTSSDVDDSDKKNVAVVEKENGEQIAENSSTCEDKKSRNSLFWGPVEKEKEDGSLKNNVKNQNHDDVMDDKVLSIVDDVVESDDEDNMYTASRLTNVLHIMQLGAWQEILKGWTSKDLASFMFALCRMSLDPCAKMHKHHMRDVLFKVVNEAHSLLFNEALEIFVKHFSGVSCQMHNIPSLLSWMNAGNGNGRMEHLVFSCGLTMLMVWSKQKVTDIKETCFTNTNLDEQTVHIIATIVLHAKNYFTELADLYTFLYVLNMTFSSSFVENMPKQQREKLCKALKVLLKSFGKMAEFIFNKDGNEKMQITSLIEYMHRCKFYTRVFLYHEND